MKDKKMTLLILGIVLFLVGLIWMLVGEAYWLNWLILIVGAVLFILSFIGKEKVAAPTAPEAAPAPAESTPAEENKPEM